MNLRVWDTLESHLAELLFDQGVTVRRAIPIVCHHHSTASVHYLALSLASAASAMEDTWPIADTLNQRSLLDLYRATAAVLADISMHGLLQKDCDTCGHLLAHWHTDPEQYFDLSDLSDAPDGAG